MGGYNFDSRHVCWATGRCRVIGGNVTGHAIHSIRHANALHATMVDWKKSKGGRPFVSADFMAESKAAVQSGLVDLWSKVLDQIDGGDADAWDVLICFLRIDSGHIFVYPAKQGKYESTGATWGVQFSVFAWQQEYEAMEEGCEDDEDKLDRQHEKLLKRWTKALASAIKDKLLQERFNALKQRRSFCIYFCDAPEFVGPATLQFLWGNKPAQAIPSSSAEELFRFILRKASLTPEHSMELDGEKVVKVDWFGGNFTDKYVDLIEQVPNLREICSDLKEFTLTDTRIKPKGVERLRALLPHVDVREETDDEDE